MLFPRTLESEHSFSSHVQALSYFVDLLFIAPDLNRNPEALCGSGQGAWTCSQLLGQVSQLSRYLFTFFHHPENIRIRFRELRLGRVNALANTIMPTSNIVQYAVELINFGYLAGVDKGLCCCNHLGSWISGSMKPKILDTRPIRARASAILENSAGRCYHHETLE